MVLSESLKNRKTHIKKKCKIKILNIPIFWYFSGHVRYSVLKALMNQTFRSIFAIHNHKSIRFGFSAFMIG